LAFEHKGSTYGVEPGVLAGKTMMQHLVMPSCTALGGAAGEAQLLSHLQHMQQLTYLNLSGCLRAEDEDHPPAAAYAALTACSKLHTLNLSDCVLPAVVWQHLFSAGRQLPYVEV
jgi:hypothetical protein